ncbi:hypothetical protein CPJCM30710_12940 [Clostridium polyendosporum]|uniref:High-affinity iron transporter n=1 Tax=Clostridium polyendosporum TaxID=69208 RepID=A0A919S101_9CLOT|nr:FTR1 family protein [Clostridium polyendosporum]GIM28628.1 hypothetical protein CPJCM30710_12940 [Clostridium polyendosporum]
MITSLVITFREFLEMLLTVIPLLVYLKKVDKSQYQKYIYSGCFTGILATILVVILILTQIRTLELVVQNVFQGSLMIFLSALILYNIVLMNNEKKYFDLNAPEKMNIRTTAFNLFLLAFITVFRESLEIILFNLPYFMISGFSIILGTLLGILSASVVMYIVYKSSLKLSATMIFNIITLVLIFIGAFMFGEGLSELMPHLGESMEKTGMLLYSIPTLLIFIKKSLKSLIKK